MTKLGKFLGSLGVKEQPSDILNVPRAIGTTTAQIIAAPYKAFYVTLELHHAKLLAALNKRDDLKFVKLSYFTPDLIYGRANFSGTKTGNMVIDHACYHLFQKVNVDAYQLGIIIKIIWDPVPLVKVLELWNARNIATPQGALPVVAPASYQTNHQPSQQQNRVRWLQAPNDIT